MKNFGTRLRRMWKDLEHLQHLHIDRHDVSGRDALEALAARRPIRR
ncbi:hypothetical protein [Actinoplanes sp. URMC 104]